MVYNLCYIAQFHFLCFLNYIRSWENIEKDKSPRQQIITKKYKNRECPNPYFVWQNNRLSKNNVNFESRSQQVRICSHFWSGLTFPVQIAGALNKLNLSLHKYCHLRWWITKLGSIYLMVVTFLWLFLL